RAERAGQSREGGAGRAGRASADVAQVAVRRRPPREPKSMTRFSASTESDAVVAAPRSAIWRALTDPDLLPRLTPLLRRIDADGDHWRWYMTGLEVMGVGISPVFTERMRFTPQSRIDYTHEPPKGVREQAGAEGSYELLDVPGGTL